MIQLIFMYYMIALDLATVEQSLDGEFCRRLGVAASMVTRDEMFTAASERFTDEDDAEAFWAFWENRDSCFTTK